MKKNKMMRTASVLLVLTLLTVCVISGTFAKYVTKAGGEDQARVAKWGFTASSVTLTDLFKTTYDGTVTSANGDVIAPGTAGSGTFGFTYGGDTAIAKPEVDYNFTVSTDGSEIDPTIKANTNIQWKLDNGAWGTWDQLMESIQGLSGDTTGTQAYKAGTLPTAFSAAGVNTHTVSWQWLYNDADADKIATSDTRDTGMGNATDLANVTLKITLNATQID